MSGPKLWFVLLGVTLLVYQPAWQGGILWDDEGHLTKPELRSVSGLARIWVEPGATQQYYPVTHSAFWVFHHLWGDATLGYHLVNIALHATSALLLWLILQRLRAPGAVLAAVMFAVHPVHVESVAWMSELKNVLSGALYLTAAFMYLEYDGSRKGRDYAAALAVFVLAALSKTVTVTLPLALLIVFWWQRGTLRWRQDMRPLVPFVIVGGAAGLVTIWAERTLIGATGAEFALSSLERALLAGRVVCFYAAKLLWPADLVFIYPRWTVDATRGGQWLFPLAVAAALAAAWAVRQRTRAPLAALLFFCVTLVPASGFFNVYPFRFSFVADHFQYLASIGLITAASALIALAAARIGAARAGSYVPVILIGSVLGVLSWRQAHLYADAETLYRETIARNPEAWIAHNNLGALLLAGEPPQSRVEEAVRLLSAAIRLKPDYAEAHYNLGTAFERLGRGDDAVLAYREVLRIDPRQPRALARLAAVDHDRASALLEEGFAHEDAGRLADAERRYRAAGALDPTRASTFRAIGRVLHKQNRIDEAVVLYRQGLALDPESFELHNDLGVLLAQQGRVRDAIPHFRKAVELRPADEGARRNLAQALALGGG